MKHLSFYELIRSIILQKVFHRDELAKVMTLSERTGLKLIEWNNVRENEKLLCYRCKRSPLCRAKILFEPFEGDKFKLLLTSLRHNHPPDWPPGCEIQKNIWDILTHPKIQEKL